MLRFLLVRQFFVVCFDACVLVFGTANEIDIDLVALSVMMNPLVR
jgi:hypothetical protein